MCGNVRQCAGMCGENVKVQNEPIPDAKAQALIPGLLRRARVSELQSKKDQRSRCPRMRQKVPECTSRTKCAKRTQIRKNACCSLICQGLCISSVRAPHCPSAARPRPTPRQFRMLRRGNGLVGVTRCRGHAALKTSVAASTGQASQSLPSPVWGRLSRVRDMTRRGRAPTRVGRNHRGKRNVAPAGNHCYRDVRRHRF